MDFAFLSEDPSEPTFQKLATAVLAGHRRLTRDICLAWDELHDMPALPLSKRRG